MYIPIRINPKMYPPWRFDQSIKIGGRINSRLLLPDLNKYRMYVVAPNKINEKICGRGDQTTLLTNPTKRMVKALTRVLPSDCM
jgi:hypothetical protein